MSRPIVAIAAVVLSLSLAAASEESPLAGTPTATGDRVYGSLDGAADRDPFTFEAPEGGLLKVSVKGRGKVPLLPSLDLADPDGVPVQLGIRVKGESTKAVALEGLRLPSSGTWTLAVRGFLGATGDYLATWSVEAEKKVLETVVVPAGGEVRCAFTAWDGTQVSFTATETSGPPLAGAHVCCPHDNPIAGTEAARKGSRLAGPRVALDRGPGRYRVVLTGSPSGDTTVAVKTSLRFPKASKRKIVLGAEPRPQSVSPSTGRDGTRFTLTGTGFTDASRVFFDGFHPAEEVVLQPDGTLAGLAPVCPASAAGVPSVVAVVNPDGQFGEMAPRFTFLGIPGPVRATPMLSPLEGGGVISIQGSGFRPGAAVSFGGVPGTDVTFRTGSLLTCVAPAHASGAVDVVVTDEFGRAGAALPGFQYAGAPAVASATPDVIPSFGGRTVTLAGTEFVPGDRVFVAGVEAVDVAVASRTSLAFTAPATASGDALLEVRDELGRAWTGRGVLVLTPSFQEATGTAMPPAPEGFDFAGESVAAGDLDADGDRDLVITASVPPDNWRTGQTETATRFLVNDGAGKFSDGNFSMFPTLRDDGDHGQADALVLGDLDGDGAAEVILSREKTLPSEDPATYYGYPAYYRFGESTDLDPATLPATRLFARTPEGPFRDETDDRIAPSGSTPALGKGDRWQASAGALGDLDGDGTEDLLIVAKSRVQYGYPTSLEWTYTKVWKYRGYPYYYYYYAYYPEKVTITEGAVAAGGTRALLQGDPGSLSVPAWTPSPVYASDGTTVLDDFTGDACAVGDLDGDGIGDAVVLAASPTRKEESDGSFPSASALRVLRGDGWGGLYPDAYAIPAPYDTENAGSGDFWHGGALALGDLDGDGDLDLVLGRDRFSYWTDAEGEDRILPALRILRNEGYGTFSEETGDFLEEGLFRTPSADTILGVRALALLDLDGDGDLDLVTAGREARIADAGGGHGPRGLLPAGPRMATRVLLNDGNGRLADATADRFPAPEEGDGLAGDGLAVADLDGDGSPDLVITAASPTAGGKRAVRILLSK